MPKSTLARVSMRRIWNEREGQFIRSLRCGLEMTQAELASAAGFRNKQHGSLIEVGKMHCPPQRVWAMAAALEVDLPDFGRSILLYQNPWLSAALFGADRRLMAEMRRAAR